MSKFELETGASMGSLRHIPMHEARATGSPQSGIITSGPMTSDPLNVDFAGITLLAIWAHPDDEAYLASLIEEFSPEIVLGFGPDGVTGHPDHMAVGRWTALAVAMQPRPPVLITTAAASVWPDEIVERMHRIGAFLPGYPDDEMRTEDLQVTLAGIALETKLAALRSHRSQIGPLVALLGEAEYARLASAEAYRPSNAAAKAWLSPARLARPV